MASRRMINKDDAENPRYFRLSVRQRYLFDHLMLYGDDDGIVPFAHIKPRIFLVDSDVDDETIVTDLDALQAKGFLTQYACPDGEPYVVVNDWWIRQSLRRYSHTHYPEPPGYTPRPEKMAPGPKPRIAAIDATQNRPEKTSSVQPNLEEARAAQSIDSDEVPWNEDGSVNSIYK